MESSKLFLLLIGIYCLILARQAHAECCTSSELVTFYVDNGDCDIVGGRGDDICQVTICADGVAKRGAYCGVRSCNIFGCNCDGGCLSGEWSKSFEDKNERYGIRIIDTLRSPL